MRSALVPADLTVRRKLMLVAIGILILGVGIGLGSSFSALGGFVAQANDANHHACVNTYTSQMRYANTPTQCSSHEFSISWSQQGVPGYERVEGEQVIVEPDDFRTAIATCPSGKHLLGGGGVASDIAAAEPQPNMFWSFPFDDRTWRIAAYNDTSKTKHIRAYAICASVGT